MNDDEMLTVAQIAEMSGIDPRDWRARVSRGRAPAADDPDLGRDPRRRQPRWKYRTWKNWEDNRERRQSAMFE